MKKRIIKIIVFLLTLLSLSTIVYASGKKDTVDIPVCYLFKESSGYSVYEGNELLNDLDCLDERKILKIRFDRKNKNTVLFAEEIDDLYRVCRLDFIKNEETVLFEFEYEINIHFLDDFTEDSLFWCERCELNNEPHILFEYNSKTETIKKLYEAEHVMNSYGERYEGIWVINVHADDKNIFFSTGGGFVYKGGSFVLDRETGEVRQSTAVDMEWGSVARYNNKIIRQGAVVTQTKSFSSTELNNKLVVIKDLITGEEEEFKLSKRYERMAGPLVLLSDDYFMVPLAITPIRDSIRNGLFGCNWTVCYSVFDIQKKKIVYEGVTTETSRMRLVDAMIY